MAVVGGQVESPDEPDRRPVLRYVEYHLVEHCNLNCNRCGHFSPLAPEGFSDPEAFARDLTQLASHFSTIELIRLLGGEPLLHPASELFAEIARAIVPDAGVHIVTNGTLLKSMPDRFWAVCRRAEVKLDLSLYPVMEKGLARIEELCTHNGVRLHVNRIGTFQAWINPEGDSHPDRAMAYCRSQFYCPYLSNSRLYVCGFPAMVQYFNTRFDQAIPDDPGIDIFDPALDGARILERLEWPVETCRFCSCQYDDHAWEQKRLQRAEDSHVALPTVR